MAGILQNQHKSQDQAMVGQEPETPAVNDSTIHGSYEAAREKLRQMLVVQDGLNTKSYDKAWIEKGRKLDMDYGLQTSQELSEFHESFGKGRWWGNTDTDLVNCRTELVDAFHFGMSMDLIKYGHGDYGARSVAAIYVSTWKKVEVNWPDEDIAYSPKEITAIIKKLQAHVLTQDDFHFGLFYLACRAVEMPLETLFLRYMGKATLNEFRQANGYSAKPRTYIKDWGMALSSHSNEDNHYLANYIDNNPGATIQDVKEYIAETYAQVLERK